MASPRLETIKREAAFAVQVATAPTTPGDLLTRRQAAARGGMSRRTLTRLARAGRVASVRQDDGRRMFRAEAIDAYRTAAKA